MQIPKPLIFIFLTAGCATVLLTGCPSKNDSPTTPSSPPVPTSTPTNTLTPAPSATPTLTPTVTPTYTPTSTVTVTPTFTITQTLTVTPTMTITQTPTLTATSTPIHGFITSWGTYTAPPGGSGKFSGVVGVAWEQAYQWLWVADSNGGDIQKFRSDGSSQTDVVTAASTPGVNAQGISGDDFGLMYVADYSHNAMVVYDYTGAITFTVTSWTGGAGSFNSILDTAVSPLGLGATIACANFGNGEIDFFHRNGTFITDITGYYARGLAYDSSGNLWVSEDTGPTVHNLYKFAPGASTAGLTITSANGTNFNGNEGVCTDSKGNVYLADQSNGRVVEMDSSGNYLFTFTVANPYGVCTDPNDNVYMTSGSAQIREYAP